MRIFIALAIAVLASVAHAQPDSTDFHVKASQLFGTRTSYDDASFPTNDLHALFVPTRACLAVELDIFYHVDSKSELQRMLRDYTNREQPFPYGLESLRLKMHLNHFVIKQRWLEIDKIVLGNFHRNSDRYEYLNFSRYVLHSPIDIEKKRSLADWGLYSKAKVLPIALESFLLHSFDKDYTAGFQAGGICSLSPALTFISFVNGVLDQRTDSEYNLQYPIGTDKTLSGGGDIRMAHKGINLSLRPLWAYNAHEFLSTTTDRKGYLRNIEMALATCPFLQMPLLHKWGFHRFGLQVDGILEKNGSDYHPNFAYDRDELNDDFLQQIRGDENIYLLKDRTGEHENALPAFLYNRENVNVRLGESGGEVGLRLQGYHQDDSCRYVNVLNLGAKYGRYSRTGEKHATSYDDSWLAELELRALGGELEANVAYWQRRTNVVQDPSLNELQIATWIAGLRYVLVTGAWFGRNDHGAMDNTTFSMFFRADNFTEIYAKDRAKERGSIFMAALETPVFHTHNWRATLQFLYRKYVPDNHIVSRVFPPNNVIRFSVNLYAAY